MNLPKGYFSDPDHDQSEVYGEKRDRVYYRPVKTSERLPENDPDKRYITLTMMNELRWDCCEDNEWSFENEDDKNEYWLEPIESPADEQVGEENTRDWPKDFKHENGNYQNKCMYCNEYFVGHKRRVVCKLCTPPADVSEELVRFYKWCLKDAYRYQQYTPEGKVERYLQNRLKQ